MKTGRHTKHPLNHLWLNLKKKCRKEKYVKVQINV